MIDTGNGESGWLNLRGRCPLSLAIFNPCSTPTAFARVVRLAIVCWLAVSHMVAFGQQPLHFRHHGNMPPGAIGQRQLRRGGPLAGYFQPVEILAPQGVKISLAESGKFAPPEEAPVKFGALIGQVYRMRVTEIPFEEGREVYPTVEVIDRLYPPEGQRARFPILIELTDEELKLALAGNYVMRVIYLEDPLRALPIADEPNSQRYFEAATSQDPLKIADELGRPMAILRMGSRVPDIDRVTGRFLFGTPPLFRYPKANAAPAAPATSGPIQHPRVPRVPRVPQGFGQPMQAGFFPPGYGVLRR